MIKAYVLVVTSPGDTKGVLAAIKRIEGVVVPVTLESTAHVRVFGPASLRMTYAYSEIDGHRVRP